jgi:hypothetical protein
VIKTNDVLSALSYTLLVGVWLGVWVLAVLL